MSKLQEEEIKPSSKKYIVSKTDSKGIIEYGNEYFVEVSGYREAELVGSPHSILRHPDMPKVIFKFMWERISQGNNIVAVVKNKAKDGRFYWVLTEFEPKLEPITGEVISHTAYRRAAPQHAIDAVQKVYAKLLEIEQASGMEASEKYFKGFLESQQKTYDTFIANIIGESKLMRLFFTAMKKVFA